MPERARDVVRQYARGSDEYVRAQPPRDDKGGESMTQYLRRVGLDDSAPTGGPAPNAPQDAVQKRTAEERRQLDAQAKQAQLAAEQEARRKQSQNSINLPEAKAAGIIWNKAADTVENIQNWLATRPTPGGRGGMLLLLLLFGAFIIPVSQGGYTRAQLLWLTLLGRTELDESNGSEPSTKPPHPPEPRPPRPTVSANGNTPGAAALPFTLPLPGGPGGPQLPS